MKTRGIIVAMFLAGMLATSSARAGVLLYYDFENDAGTTIDNKGSLATAGTLVGADATTVGPAAGFSSATARTFDGTSTHIDSNISTVLMDVYQDGNYTMSAWLRPLSNTGDHMVFGTQGGTFLHNGTRNDQYWQGHYGNDIGGGSVSAIPLGDWRHVTWRYANGEEQIFVNGVSVAGPTPKGAVNTTANIWIGNSESARRFQGDLDDVVIYEEALAANQISFLSQGGDPLNLPAPPQVLAWDFWNSGTSTGSLEGWEVLNGGAHFRSGDGGGMTPANSSGGYAHDGDHDTFLVQSPVFALTGDTVDGTNALLVQFAGGAGDQDNQGIIFNNPADVLAFNGGNSNSNGQKGLAFLNVNTGQYEATLFELDNGGTNLRSYTLADLLTAGVQLNHAYRLQYFENDEGGWGWGQVNYIELAAYTIPEPSTVVMLLGLGGAGLLVHVTRRRRR